MFMLKAVWLIVTMATLAQADPEMPEAWKQKVEAAAKAREAGRSVEAGALLAEVVREAKKLGKGDFRLARPLELLACFYLDKKRKHYAKAEPLLRRALAIREKAQGPEHPDVAGTLVCVAACLLVSKEKQAETVGPMLQRAIAIYEKLKGKDDPDVANALHFFSAWHLSRKEYDAAESALTRAVAIGETAFGPMSAELAELLDDLGDLHCAQAVGIDIEAVQAAIWGNPERESKTEKHAKQAESFYKRALAIREKAVKSDDRDIAETLYNLGQLAVVRGRPMDGEQYFERWLVLQEKTKAPASEKQGTVLCALAVASMERNEFVQAEGWLAKTQAFLQTTKGAESDDVSVIQTARADVALKAGRFDDAERFSKQGLAVQAKLIGTDDRDVKQAEILMTGRYQDDAENRGAIERWQRLDLLATEASEKHKHDSLGQILEGYVELLRRTNRAVPRPTAEDLAYLKKVGAVEPSCNLDHLSEVTWLTPVALDDDGLTHIARLYNLARLYLSRPVTDAGLAQLKVLFRLRMLDLERARITDAGLAHLVGLNGLEELDLTITRISDKGLEHLKGLTNLRELCLDRTQVTDAGLEHLMGLKNLRKLNLSSTKVTQAGIDRLRLARPELAIDLKPKSR